ncbi:hypothetical protein Tco_1212800 [Tanacetum coccineum]
MAIPRLDELVVGADSRGLFNGMLVYFDRENGKDLDFANGLHNLWVELLERTNERHLFITELEGLCPSVMTNISAMSRKIALIETMLVKGVLDSNG